jgi:hypothetical protein
MRRSLRTRCAEPENLSIALWDARALNRHCFAINSALPWEGGKNLAIDWRGAQMV